MKDILQRLVYGGVGAIFALSMAGMFCGDALPRSFSDFSRIVAVIVAAICLASGYVEWRDRKRNTEQARVFGECDR